MKAAQPSVGVVDSEMYMSGGIVTLVRRGFMPGRMPESAQNRQPPLHLLFALLQVVGQSVFCAYTMAG